MTTHARVPKKKKVEQKTRFDSICKKAPRVFFSTSLVDSQRTSCFTGRKFVGGRAIFAIWLGCVWIPQLDGRPSHSSKAPDRFGTRLREPEPDGETATEKLGL